ncbi:MAG TPA: cobalamin-independent methionine synthase II family protein [Candidatus Dormibacteraeota bacterium]|nr:cobalamin-independent methionine synthase II family protein [Candidatus Dormibacteraeota bacterium]
MDMTQSSDRIRTTHAGSLPRPPDLLELLQDRAAGRPVDSDVLQQRVRRAVADAVRRQAEAGIDVVSDGEMSKIGFANYVQDRMTGFGGEPTTVPAASDVAEFPDLAARMYASGQSAGRMPRPGNDAAISYTGREQLATDLENFSDALAVVAVEGGFLPAASPGCVVQIMRSSYYPDRRAYLYALAQALREEYRAIVEAGFTLQVDCPDLAMGRHWEFASATLAEFRANLELHVEALNYGLEGIDPERVRVHVCWGNYPGPHHRDVELRDILDVVYRVRASGISIEAANPRHEHEWTVFAERPLPDGRYLVPGVIDSCTNYIEHPELVAQRIVRFAQVVGRENVIAGTDCGFGTFAGFGAVVPGIAYAKLGSLVEGARIATLELWGGAQH